MSVALETSWLEEHLKLGSASSLCCIRGNRDEGSKRKVSLIIIYGEEHQPKKKRNEGNAFSIGSAKVFFEIFQESQSSSLAKLTSAYIK